MKSKYCNEEALSEATEKLESPKFLVKAVESHWHSFVHKTITSGRFENVNVPHLIKVEFNKWKMDAINLSKSKSQ